MKIAVVFDSELSAWGHEEHMLRMEEVIAAWKRNDPETEPDQEYQVAHALIECGHAVTFLPLVDDPSSFMAQIRELGPDVAFNCTETFQNIDRLDFVVPALLEAEGICYTGAPPAALVITRNKALSKKILAHHGIHVPHFVTYRLGDRVPARPEIDFPVIVKPLKLDASDGISMASVVRTRDELAARVEFVHQRFSGAAIAEQFVEGRELYAGILGNGKKLEILPPTELVFDKETRPEERIATKNAKWDEPYRQRKGIKNVLARPISKVAQEQLEYAAVTAYRTLWLRDYARLDVRLDADDRVWVMEANANPYLNRDHEMAIAAARFGLEWVEFIDRIVRLARARYHRTRAAAGATTP